MNSIRHTLCLSALLLMFASYSSCQSTSGTKNSAQPANNDKEMSNAPFGLEPLEPAQEARDESLGIKKISGKLSRTKGSQAMVDGIILKNDFIRGDEGKAWKSEYEALLGKRVEVKGAINRHWCGPMEQCLSQGYIDSMDDIEFLRAK